MTDYNRPELLRVIELLESWAGDQLPPPNKLSGICVNLALAQKLPMADWGALVAEAAKTWPEWSGDPLYPVAHPNLLPETAYTALGEVPKWAGEYGAARRRLCQHVANWIRENPARAEQILSWECLMQKINPDPYRVEAARMFQVPYAQVTDEQRRAAKNVLYQNFYQPGEPLLPLRARGK